jgi:hypothetical protein
VEYYQRHFERWSVCALGQPFVIVDNTRRPRPRLPASYWRRQGKSAPKATTSVLETINQDGLR